MNKLSSSQKLHLASLAIPCGLLLLAMVLLRALPFGNFTVLTFDAGYQYLDFAAYVNSLVRGENTLLYTFQKNMGGEMVSLLAYYLLSPFSILFAFANARTVHYFYTAVIILKLSFCGLSFFYASGKRFGVKPIHLLFSTGYALMAYNTMYGMHIMWLDGVIILPLLGLGLFNLWQGKSSRLYVFSIAYALMTNFYIGYMLCIASVIFCIAHFATTDLPLNQKWPILGKYVFASCIGGFASAFIWLPTFLALLDGRASQGNSFMNWNPTFNLLGLAGKLAAGTSSVEQLAFGTPHVFCGTAALLLLVVFFLYKGFSLKARITVFTVLAFFVACFYFRILNIAWHGFSSNNSFNFRNAFIFSYLLLTTAQHVLKKHKAIPRWCYTASALLLLMMFAALVGMKYLMGLSFLSLPGIAISAVTLIAAALYFMENGIRMQLIAGAMGFACLFEMGANYYLSMKAVLGIAPTLMVSEYESYIDQVAPAIDYVKEKDTGFYRMEKTFRRDHNDSMTLGYYGLTHFSSSQKKSVLHFEEKLGFRNGGYWAQYGTGSTAEVDTLLGVKYVLSQTDLAAQRGYTLLTTINGIGIYENLRALPIAMVADASVQDVSMEEADFFALHNRIWSGMTGTERQLLHPAQAEPAVLENLTAVVNGDGTTTYTRIDAEKQSAICYRIPVTQEMPVYYYFSAPEIQEAHIEINGIDDGVYFDTYRWDISGAGTHQPGQTLTITIIPEGQQLTVGKGYFYYEDLAALDKAAADIRNRPAALHMQTSDHLSGTFEAKSGQVLFFTIPYDTGWKLYIDGEPHPTMPVLDALLGAQVPDGVHTYELRFVPRGIMLGFVLSAAAILTAAVWLTAKSKRQKNRG